MQVTDFLSIAEQEEIVLAIQKAEQNTSGEIRIHIEKRKIKDLFHRATRVFSFLKMHKTSLRNGVLIYINLDCNTIVILGDKGINTKVPSDFWEHIKDDIIESFKDQDYKEGLINGVLAVGKELKTYFPSNGKKDNELPDEISFGS